MCISLLLVLNISTQVHSDPNDEWYNVAWTYRKEISFNTSQMDSGSYTNFPVLINITDTDLRDEANSNGSDILFTNQTGTKLNHEVEYWNDSTGRLVAWINVTSLVYDDDNIIYMYYGNSASGNQQNVPGTWDSNFLAVYHLNGTNYQTCIDSTGNYDPTGDGGTPDYGYSGVSDGSVDFTESSNEYITVPRSTDLYGKTHTVSAWINPDTFRGGTDSSSRNGILSSYENYYWFFTLYNQGYVGFYQYIGGTYYSAPSDSCVVSTDEWSYVAGKRDGTSSYVFYNGNKVGNNTGLPDSNSGTFTTMRIGYHYSTARDFDGVIDELRLSNIARSDDWLKTEYNSVANAYDGGFFTLGDEETQTGNTLPTIETPTPPDDETDVAVSITQLSVYINDTNGDGINWTIETSPDIGSQYNYSSQDGNGSKSCAISGLQYDTWYYWWVNATNNASDNTTGNWTSTMYDFGTGDGYTQTGETPSNGSTDVSISTSTWNVTINTRDGIEFNWTLETRPNVGSASGNDATNGSKQTSLSGLLYSTEYTVYLNITNDTHGGENHVYTFTTGSDPTIWHSASFGGSVTVGSAPSNPTNFLATTISRTTINLTWTEGINTDKTRIEYHDSEDLTWNVGDHSLLYNDTAELTQHTGLSPSQTVYYKAWCWNETESAYSTGVTTNNTTLSNTAPTITDISPANNSDNQEISFTWSCTIEDVEDTFNWTIECSNGQNSGLNGVTNGSKELEVSGLSYDTQYTIWVNVTDGYDLIKGIYYFTTKSDPIQWHSSSFGGSVTVYLPVITSVDDISSYSHSINPLQINATVESGTPDNISLWYRYSSDNFSNIDYANWDTFCYDNLQHTNVSNCSFSPINNTLLWISEEEITGNFDGFSGMCVHNGTIYFSPKDYDGPGETYTGYDNVYAIYLGNGTTKWTYEMGNIYGSDSCILFLNELVYAQEWNGSADGNSYMHCLYASNGTLKWKTNLNNTGSYSGSPLYDPDNDLIIAQSQNKLYGVYPLNGTVKWSSELMSGSPYGCSPSYYDGIVYALCRTSTESASDLYAFYSNNGTTKWKTNASGMFWDMSPVIVPENNALYISNDVRVSDKCYLMLCHNLTTGENIWSLNLSPLVNHSVRNVPAYADGFLYVLNTTCIFKINASTEVMSDEERIEASYNFTSNGYGTTIGYSSPVYSNGYIYTSRYEGNIYCFNATTLEIEWIDTTINASLCLSNPTIADGIFLIVSDNGYMYAFGDINQFYGTTDWEEWTNDSNPDLESPWTWNFDFPEGYGYYEFFSIGTVSNNPEGYKSVAETSCYYKANIEISIENDSWIGGNPSSGESIIKNFTFWQNGSTTVDVTIIVNSINNNYTLVNYSDYGQIDEYYLNFTTDEWVTETNINVSVSPPNTYFLQSFSTGAQWFGVRLRTPMTFSHEKQEDFEIILSVTEHT